LFAELLLLRRRHRHYRYRQPFVLVLIVIIFTIVVIIVVVVVVVVDAPVCDEVLWVALPVLVHHEDAKHAATVVHHGVVALGVTAVARRVWGHTQN
jgi:hypothetical protein